MKHLILLIAVGMVVSAKAQTSINSSYFQVMGARALGPSTMSGRISAIEGITHDGQINLYVGTAGGGIWKSQNGGISFKIAALPYKTPIPVGPINLCPEKAKKSTSKSCISTLK